MHKLDDDHSNLLSLAQRTLVTKSDEQFLSLPKVGGLVLPEAVSKLGFRFELMCPDAESDRRIDLTCALGSPQKILPSLCILSCRLLALDSEPNFTSVQPLFDRLISYWEPDIASVETASLGNDLLLATGDYDVYRALGAEVAWSTYYKGLKIQKKLPTGLKSVENYHDGTLLTTGTKMPICPSKNEINRLAKINIELLDSGVVSYKNIWPGYPGFS